MSKKAADFINEAKSKISSIETALTEAHALSEKPENKGSIENAMASLENISNILSSYKD